MSDRDELHLLSGAYALNALDGVEKARFEAYLLTAEEARAEVASLSDTAVLIGLASEPVAPPAELRARLMAQIAVTPQLPAIQAARPPLVSIPSKASTRATARWFNRPVAILAAAAAAVALFVGGNVLGLANANHGEQQAASLTAIYSASDSRQSKANVAGGGTATFVWSAELRRSAVLINELPSLADGKVYELWYIDAKSNATPAGTFSAAASGATVRILDGKMTGGDTLGITVEPQGGSKKPTSAPIVAVASA